MSRDERGLFLQLAFFTPLFAIALKSLTLTRVLRFATSAATSPTHRLKIPEADTARQIRAVAGIVERHAPLRGNCLSRSLALTWLLQRRGIACEMRMGVRNERGQVRAHAWVETNGVPLNDSANVWRAFAPFEGSVLPPKSTLQ